jgi:AhpD family alkylhydroperoxidase
MKTTAISLALASLMGLALAVPALAEDMSYEDALKDVEATLGFVPDFIARMPHAGLPGAWQQLKALEFSDNTALDGKTKVLIELAVVSQIPCDYCIWADTEAARAAGATDEEIAEAVAVAATGRFWSTMLNGLQIDLPTFKADFGRILGGEAAEAK